MPIFQRRGSELSKITFEALALYAGIAACSSAYASPMAVVLCDVAYIISGDVGRAIGTCGIIMLGLGALFGKVSWGMAATVAIGIGIMMDSGEIAALILGLGGSPC